MKLYVFLFNFFLFFLLEFLVDTIKLKNYKLKYNVCDNNEL